MSSTTIEGVYRGGKVELATIPEGLAEGTRVRVEVLAETEAESPPDREALRRQAFADMKRGLNLGGAPYPTRDEIYDRHAR